MEHRDSLNINLLDFTPVSLSALQHWTKEAKREDAHIYEGKIPIRWYAAFFEDTLLGCIGLLQPYKSMSEVRIRGWYVPPSFRRLGIGKFLLENAVKEAKDLGFGYVEMKTKYKNIADGMGGWEDTGVRYKSFGGQKTKPGPGYKLIYNFEENHNER